MIERVLPPGVSHCEAWDDRAQVDLFPSEEACLVGAVEKRRLEFATVRRCARVALGQLGHPAVPVLPGEHGAPTWPVGVVGSMTHCVGYRAAVVADQARVVTIGIDAEHNEPLPDDVLGLVSRPEERDMLDAVVHAGTPGETAWDTLLFSAKESVYKAWFPLARRFLDFQEATVALSPDGTFTGRLLVAGPLVGRHRLETLSGRWVVERGLVVTAIVVTA